MAFVMNETIFLTLRKWCNILMKLKGKMMELVIIALYIAVWFLCGIFTLSAIDFLSTGLRDCFESRWAFLLTSLLIICSGVFSVLGVFFYLGYIEIREIL